MSQMAKDVTVFLAWAAEPELDGVCTAFASSLHVCAALLVVQADVA